MAEEEARYPLYPVMLDLTGALAVVVGGGSAAERRASILARHGADVAVVTSDVTEGLAALEAEGTISLERREYVRGDLEGARLAICVSGTDEVLEAVFAESKARGCLVNVAGRPDLCDFILPSVFSRGLLQIGISTQGSAPELARRVKKDLRRHLGPEWERYVQLVGEVRGLAAEQIGSEAERERVMEAVLDSDILARVRAGADITAKSVLAEFMGRGGGSAGR